MPKLRFFIFALVMISIVLPETVSAEKTIKTAQKIVVLDPGHGGSDTGIRITNNLFEKDITLRLAKKTARLLDEKYNVILTRTADELIPAHNRVSRANREKADIYVSLHLGSGHGDISFIHYAAPIDKKPGTVQHQADWANRHSDYIEKSKKFLQTLKTYFSKHFKDKTYIITSSPSIILQGADMPAVLLEPFTVFQLLKSPESMDRLLETCSLLISRSIDTHLNKTP